MTKVKKHTLDFAVDTDGELVELDLQLLMQTGFLGGGKGAGKTSALKRLFEAAYHAGAQCVALATLGKWWSLRIAKNGRGKGLANVFVFGGKYGDVPINASSGRTVAQAIVKRRLHAVLDVEQMRKKDRAIFLADFLEELQQLKKDEEDSPPMVLFIDEMQNVAAQKTRGEDAERLKELVADLARECRNYRMGLWGSAQRSANVDKDFIALVDFLIVMKTTYHTDRKVYALWVEEKGERDDDDYAWLKKLRRLEKGDGYLYLPSEGIFARVHIKLPDTYDATKTAVIGEKVARIGRLSKLDVKKLGEELSGLVEQAAANDPTALKARVAELERQLALKSDSLNKSLLISSEMSKQAKPAKLDKGALKRIEKAAKQVHDAATAIRDALQGKPASVLIGAIGPLFGAANVLRGKDARADEPRKGPLHFGEKYGTNGDPAKTAAVFETMKNGRDKYGTFGSPERAAALHEAAQRVLKPAVKDVEAVAIVGKQKTMLGALSYEPLSRNELATAVGINPNSTFRAYVARLKKQGLLGEKGDGDLYLTEEGGKHAESVPLDYDSLCARNSDVLVGLQRRILDRVKEVRFEDRDSLAHCIGTQNNSTFRAYVARMKRRGVLVEESGKLKLSPIMERGIAQ